MSELFNASGPFATGIADIDSEHAQLHIAAKRLAAQFAQAKDATTVLADLADFIDLLDAHFRHEETFFDQLEPIRAKAHIKDHALLVLSLKLFAESLKERQGMDGWNDFIDLEDVLLKHIILFDLDFRP